MSNSRATRDLPPQLLAMLLLFAYLVPMGRAQATPGAESDELAAISAAASNDSGPAGIIPSTRGFNATLGTSSQHDSTNGWSSILNPNVAYRLNQHFSVDVGVPLYGYIKVYRNTGTAAKPVNTYASRNGVFGDTALSLQGSASAPWLDYNGIITMGLPSGNSGYGLGAGQVTYSINNHFEKTLRLLTPDIELGVGDSSNLVDQRVLKSYVAVGPLAHFQAGMSLDLPFNASLEADAYEELPLAKDLVYSTTGKGKKKVTTATNEDPGEDNGFLASLDIPLSRHVTLSGFYSRSLRDHDDIAGFSLTLLAKAPPRAAPVH